MSINELQHRLLCDLRKLNLPIEEVEIYLRPFSKTYYGRYYPVMNTKMGVKPKIYVYPFEKDGTVMTYTQILKTVIHEFCHHLQYSRGHTRIKGIMHDTHFWSLYNKYNSLADKLNMFGGVVYEV